MSHETIYRSLFVQARGALRNERVARLRSLKSLKREVLIRFAHHHTTCCGGGAGRGPLSHSFTPERATPFRRWARSVAEQRRGANIATVAIANRLARIVWRVWRENRPFVVARPVAA